MSYIRINKHYVQLPHLYLGLVELLLLMVAAHAAQLLVAAASAHLSEFDLVAKPSASSTLLFALVMSCCTQAMGVYGALLREGFLSLVLRVLVSFFLLGCASLFVLNLVLPKPILSSAGVFWGILFSGLLVIPARVFFLKLVDLSQLRRRILLFGAGTKAQKLLDEIGPEISSLGIEVAGCIHCPNETLAVDPQLVVPEPSDWLAYVRQSKISQIVVCPDERRRDINAAFPLVDLLDCKLAGVPATEVCGFYERELGKIDLTSLQPSWMLFSDGFNNSKRARIVKRLCDMVLACGFFAVLWPLMLLTAIAVRLESPGPVLYHQLRVGYNGRIFRIYKFRSMRQDAEKAGAQWATKNDSRITRVGAFIRNTRLDELPQLFNVVSGSMSFVGPRPERPEFVTELEQQIPFYGLRHKVKPGLMGWAQLKYPYGASVEDARHKLQYDLYYTKNHSFMIDVLIMIQTVEIILLGKGVR